ncbi:MULTISPECIES: non-ribosomal peptide synthetase [unclassified Pseudomonas]|uniref:non-ribosomal peptide synthetase n=1 Tax=unclassified Pseudomonas TaxID=196821 RepID=UPI000CCFE060|nr:MULTISPECIES: non-ribosomal peptide synthetase [unclassified Pseudomonas]POA14535.1 non-ribosomal peptide synthetase [Pseudomonas sp. MPBD7-1]
MNNVIANDVKSVLEDVSQGYPLSPQQQATWTRERQPQRYVASLQLCGKLNRERLLEAFNHVAQRYEILRTVLPVPAEGAEPVQQVCAHEPLSALPEHLPTLAQQPFCIAMRDTDGGCVLELGVSAWSVDHWSMTSVLDRLSDSYLNVALPDSSLVLQYADLSEGYRGLLSDSQGSHYWAGRGIGAPDEAPPATPRETEQSATLHCASAANDTWLFARWVLFLSRWTRHGRVVTDYLAPGARFTQEADLIGPIGRMLRLAFNVDWTIDSEKATAAIAEQTEMDLSYTDHFDGSTEHAKGAPRFLFVPTCALPHVFAGMAVEKAVLAPPPSAATLQLEVTAPGKLRLTGRGLPPAQFEAVISDLNQLFRFPDPQANTHFGARQWSALTHAPLTGGADIGAAVGRWASQYPQRPALIGQDATLSYAELEHSIRAAAASLRARGVSPGHTVALQTPRGPAWIIWWLAVWRVGGTLLPLTAESPPERTADWCRRAGVYLLVSTIQKPEVAADLPPVLVPPPQPALASDDDTGSAYVPHPSEPAYILFTSGSTGAPKASAISHGALAAYLGWASPRYASDKRGGTLVHSELGFDFTQTCLWLPLLAGETIRFAPEPLSLDKLYSMLLTEPTLSFIKLTPAHLQGIAALESLVPRPLRWPDHVVVGGAALSGGMLPGSLCRSPSIVHNEYGPTEATVGCCVHSEPADVLSQGPVSIGSATPQTALFALDAHLRQVAPGEDGELYIAGAQLAMGYVGNPRETAQRFLPHPHADHPGERIYRTGDRVRRTDRSHYVFLGRLDDMIKRNGVRIEPGHISAQMLRHPAVSGCHTFAQQGPGQLQPAIICAVTLSAAVETRSLHAWLANQLPALMLPNRIITIEKLPCTPQGKVDERQLLAGLCQEKSADNERLAEGLESKLGAIWSKVLGVPDLAPSSHFFAEGGDSIRAITVAVEARKQGVMLSVEHLFEHPVLRDLAVAAAVLEVSHVPPLPAAVPHHDALPPGIEDTFPISYLQMGMIFQNELDGRYHDIFSYRLGMQLDEHCLLEAARRLVARHPGLRTSFDIARDGSAVQHVWSQGPDVLHCEDLSTRSPDEQQRTIAQWIDLERERGFDVRKLPLLRLQVHRLDDQTIQFTVSFHHAIMDGWSDQQIHAELFADYRALVEKRQDTIEPPPGRYRDFIAAELAALHSQQTRAFWRDYLSGASPTRLAPVAVARLETGTRDSHWNHSVTLPERLCTQLQAAARQSSEPLAVLLNGAHLVALRLLTGHREILSCSVANVRLDEEAAERTVGLYINTLPVRATIGNETWRTLVCRIGQQQREAFGFRRLPFSEIQREAGVERLSESLFYFTNFHNRIPATSTLVQHDRFAHEVTSFPLTASFNIEPTTGLISYNLAFDARRFSQARADQAAQCYQAALDALANDIDAPLPSLHKLPQLRSSVLIARETTPASQAANVLELFDEQVRLGPNATAVRDKDGILSYRELGLRSMALASAFSARGMGPGSVVGIMLPRTADLPLAILGVLRAGACFVVLDADDPPARFAHVLADTALVVCSEASAHLIPSQAWVSLRTLEEQAPSSPGPLGIRIDPALPAYRMYTSGSTGTPKCVEISHASYANVLRHFRDLLRTRPGDRVMLTSALSFDISLLELGLPLASGAMLHVLTREQALDPNAYQMAEHTTGNTVIQATPSLWSALRLRGWPRTPRSQVLVGGEALPAHLGNWLCEVADEAWNVYGPTETTIWSTAARLEPDKHTIGTPIAATRCYLLDDQLDPVPQGSVGLLYIGGAGVSLGYAGAPAMTALTFLPDEAGARMYCTGDNALLDETGALVFLGRNDRQIKIAGHRLELEEVEARLLAHPDIAEAVVVQHPALDERLVAYLVSHGGEDNIPDLELRNWLSAHLPPYALPRAYLWLKELPRTLNGKLDRRALPAPSQGRPTLSARYAAPENPLEQVLQRIWCKVLKVDQIGVDDSFIELGGYSLTSIRIIAQVRELFDVQIGASALFKTPTIRQLAQQLQDDAPASAQLEAKAEILLSIL